MNYFSKFFKLLSGRYLLTVVSAISFVIIVNTMCKIMIIHAAEFKLTDILSLITPISLIISNVFTFYFLKQAMGSTEVVEQIDLTNTTNKQE